MEYIKIGDIAKSIVSGGTPKSTKSEYYNGNIPWLNTKEINFNRIYSTEKCITDAGLKNSSAKYIKENCVIIAMYGATAGRAAINKIPLTTNQACCNIEVDASKMDYNYVYYAIKNDWEHLASLANGGAQQNLNSLIIKEFKIPYVDLNTQKKVSKILSSIDKKIELNNEINNNLYELAINYLNEKVEETEVSVSKFANIQGGYAFKSKDLIDTYTKNRIIKIKNLRSEINADVINSQFVENEVVERLDNKFRLSKGDVAIAMTGAELGKTGFIYGNDNYYLNQRVGVIRGNNKASELYLNILFLSDEFQTLLNSKGYGSAQPNVSTSDIENILINDITEDNLKELYEIIKPIYEKIISNSEEILNLEQLRDTLLPKLMNGEIDLENIEI